MATFKRSNRAKQLVQNCIILLLSGSLSSGFVVDNNRSSQRPGKRRVGQGEPLASDVASYFKDVRLAGEAPQIPLINVTPISLSHYSRNSGVGGIQQQLQQFNPNNVRVAAMTTAGILFSLGVLYALGLTTTEDISTFREAGSAVPNAEEIMAVAETIVDATVPMTASDVICVATGEGVAGLIGGASSFLITRVINWQKEAKNVSPTVSDVVADGDYFFARAATLPLLDAMGLPPFVAVVGTVVLATLPYEIIKIQSKRRKVSIEEDIVMQELLDDQIESENQLSTKAKSFFNPSKPEISVDVENLKPVKTENNAIDLVEIFSDITLWLEFDVLSRKFGGTLLQYHGQSLPAGAESAMFGAVACLSAQLYADVLHYCFGFGSDTTREKIRERSAGDWFAIYVTKLISGATLFGVYDTVQEPVEGLVSILMSGAVIGCIGSNEFHMCVDSFITANPTEPTAGAQFRAFATSFASAWNSLFR